MENRMETERKPLPVVVDTMPGRDLRVPYIEQWISTGASDLRRLYPDFPFGDEEPEDFPY